MNKKDYLGPTVPKPIELPPPPPKAASSGWIPPKSEWDRSTFCSVWQGESLELIVVQCSGSSEAWKWTARGWREPSESDGADTEGWVEATTRTIAEQAALKWYMEKDE